MLHYTEKRQGLQTAVRSASPEEVTNILSDHEFMMDFFNGDILMYPVILFIIENDMVDTMNSIVSSVDTISVGNSLPTVNSSNKYILGQLLKNGQNEMFKLILRFGKHRTLNPMSVISPSYYDNACICFCVQDNLTELTKLLLENPNIDAGARNNKPLTLVARNNNVEIMKMLLNRSDVDAGARANQALIFAVKNSIDIDDSNIEMVELLLNRSDVDPSARDNMILKIIGNNNNCRILSLLAKRGDVDFRCKTLFGETIDVDESFVEFCIRKNNAQANACARKINPFLFI